jgi:hypothetical protein
MPTEFLRRDLKKIPAEGRPRASKLIEGQVRRLRNRAAEEKEAPLCRPECRPPSAPTSGWRSDPKAN